MNRGILRISSELLMEHFMLGKDHSIIGVSEFLQSDGAHGIILVIEGPKMPKVMIGDITPDIIPEYYEDENGEVTLTGIIVQGDSHAKQTDC